MSRAKYLHLLDDLEVKRWYGNVCRGSRITADVYLRRLGAFCVTQGTSPSRLVEMGERSVTDLLMDARAAAALIAFAGVRPHVIGNHWGTDGLRIEDFLEVEVDNAGEKVQFKNIPTLIHVRKAVSKARRIAGVEISSCFVNSTFPTCIVL